MPRFSVTHRQNIYVTLLALGCEKLVVIRFNPDGYTDSNKKKHPSCFPITNNVMKINVSAYNKRYNKLVKNLNHILQHEPTETYTQINLFYDE